MIKNVSVGHIPVMINEVVDALKPCDEGVFVDGTFGRGGHSEAILQAAATRVYGIDRDPEAVSYSHLTLPTILLV